VSPYRVIPTIRPETPVDRCAVSRVHRRAFGRAEEADLVDRLRQEASPTVSIIATDDAGENRLGEGRRPRPEESTVSPPPLPYSTLFTHTFRRSMPSDVARIARRFIQAWNAGHREVVDALAAPDLVVSYAHFPEPIHGPDAFKQMLADTHRHFPDLEIDTHDVIARDNRAAVHWTYRGTFQAGEMFGVTADGQAVDVTGMTRYQIEGGRVHREQGIVDNFRLMMQLGASPTPNGNA